MKNLLKIKKGFTLIELLIVVAIIGVLATLLMANFIGIRQRARDAQRKADIRQLQSALEFYRSDIGNYPATISNCTCGANACLQDPTCKTTYMQKIPTDSLGASYYNSGNYFYYTNGSGTIYTLIACLENTADTQGTATKPSGIGAPSGCVNYYVVINP